MTEPRPRFVDSLPVGAAGAFAAGAVLTACVQSWLASGVLAVGALVLVAMMAAERRSRRRGPSDGPYLDATGLGPARTHQSGLTDLSAVRRGLDALRAEGRREER